MNDFVRKRADPAPLSGLLLHLGAWVALITLVTVVWRPSAAGAAIAAMDLRAVANMTFAYSINASGSVAGFRANGAMATAVVFENNVSRDVPLLAGEGYARATAISDAGLVVGWASNTASGTPAAFTYSGTTRVAFNAGAPTNPWDVNASGVIVGKRPFVNGGGFRTGPGGAPPLQTFGSSANGVNAAGDAVSAGNVLYRADTGTAAPFGLPAGSTGGDANDINGARQVVGFALFSTTLKPYLYDATSNQFTVLPVPANHTGEATAINSLGVIVGTSAPTTSFLPEPFVYVGGEITWLNALVAPGSGWVLRTAQDINDLNQVVGTGTLNGVPAAYVMTLAVPEPDTIGALAVIAAAILPRRTRRR